MTLVVAPAYGIYVGDTAGSPRTDNGEADIAKILEELGFNALYEAFLYPIRLNDFGECTYGFTPDFWIPSSDRHPESHIEVTWPDREHPCANPRRYRSPQEVIGTKQEKARETYRIYGMSTLLLDYRACMLLMQNPEQLHNLLDQLHEHKETQDGLFRPGAHHFARR